MDEEFKKETAIRLLREILGIRSKFIFFKQHSYGDRGYYIFNEKFGCWMEYGWPFFRVIFYDFLKKSPSTVRISDGCYFIGDLDG